MGDGTLIGYFTKKNDARNAFRELTKKGFSRITLTYKDPVGALHATTPSLWFRILRAPSGVLPWIRQTISGHEPDVMHDHAR
ncbi:hypothetical protein JZU71_02105, partial [bacterium]|nr:hypothetical protein [bacterium]